MSNASPKKKIVSIANVNCQKACRLALFCLMRGRESEEIVFQIGIEAIVCPQCKVYTIFSFSRIMARVSNLALVCRTREKPPCDIPISKFRCIDCRYQEIFNVDL